MTDSTEKPSELLPCPFCGGDVERVLIEERHWRDNHWIVRCKGCAAENDPRDWNHRHRPTPPSGVVEALQDAIADAISTIENECGYDSEAQPHTHDGVMAALSDRLLKAYRSASVSLEGQKKEAGVVGVRDYDAAIQEAAKVCDEIEQRYRAQADGDDQNSDSALFAGGMQAGAKYCATMVRALKSGTPQEQQWATEGHKKEVK